jgi:phage terminase large subunit GpA-like protein
MLQETYSDHTGKEFRISGGLIDSGGTRRGYQKHSRTTEVYEWCSKNRVMIPIKGLPGRNGEMVSYKIVATFPNSNRPIPGGLKRANLRVDFFKDELENKLARQPDDPGALSYHAGIDETFAKHFTTERKDENGDWQHDKAKGRNDYFDCNTYALALREMWKLRIPRKEQPASGRRVLSKGVQNG